MVVRIFFAGWLLIALGGCSIVRQIAADETSKQARFHPPGSRQLEKTANGLNGEQQFRLLLACTGSVDETKAWYVHQFRDAGWTVVKGTGESFLWFERKPPLAINMEKVWIWVSTETREGKTFTSAKLSFDGYYWWGWGSHTAHFLVLMPFFWMGEGAEIIENKLWWTYAYW